jgi:hypothetical protein
VTSVKELELSGILKSPSSVCLIMSSAKEIPVGASIAVPFEGESRRAKVEECTRYRDRFLLWLEVSERYYTA